MIIKPTKGCSTEVLAQIAEVVPVPVIISNFGGEGIFDHKIAFANTAFTELTGFKNEHLIGRSPEFLYDRNAAKSDDAIMEFYNKCGYADEFELQINAVTKKGESKKLNAKIVASAGGSPAEMRSFIITFTEVAQAASAEIGRDEPEFDIPVAPVINQAPAKHEYDIPVAPVISPAQTEQVKQEEKMNLQSFGKKLAERNAEANKQRQQDLAIEQENQAAYATAQQVSELQELMRQKKELQDKLRNKKSVEESISAISQTPAENTAANDSEEQTQTGFVETDYDSIISQIAADLSGLDDFISPEAVEISQPEAKTEAQTATPEDLTSRHSVLENMITSIKLKTSQEISKDARITELKNDVQDPQIEDEIDYYAKTRFLSNMSHDLRTPLNAIIGFSEVIRDQLFGPIDNQRYVSYANDIFKSGQELLATISEILELSEVDTEDNLQLEEGEFDICETIDSVLDLLSAKAFQTDVKMIKRLQVSDMLMNGDRRKLKQAVGGIIGNAIKSSPAGGKIEIVSEIDENGDFKLITYLKSANLIAAKASMGTLLGTVTSKVESEYPEISLAKRFTEAHDGKFNIFNSATSGTEISLTIPKNRLIDGRKAKLQVINNN